MIRVSDLLPLGAPRGLPSSPVRGVDAGTPSTWFDDDAVGAGARIAADLCAASRGLSVAQHAERILGHLRGDPDERA